jgi:hypothetical protein
MWCLRSSSVIVSSKENKTKKNERKQNNTKQKNPTKCPKIKCNTVSLKFSACRCSSVVVSSKVGRKKMSGNSSVNGYRRLWLTCLVLQPAVAGGFIYADLRSELNTHLAPQALFT